MQATPSTITGHPALDSPAIAASFVEDAPVFFWLGIIVLVAVVIGVVWLYRRRRRQQPHDFTEGIERATAKDAVRQIIDDFPDADNAAPGPRPHD